MPAKNAKAAETMAKFNAEMKAADAKEAGAKGKVTKPLGNAKRVELYTKANAEAKIVKNASQVWRVNTKRRVAVTPKQHKRLLQNASPAERKLNA